MALLMFDGFESAPTIKAAYGTGTNAVAVTGRDGIGKALKVGTTDIILAPSSPVSQMILGLGMMTDNYSSTIFTLNGDGGGTTHLTFGVNGVGQFTVWRGAGLSGTLLGTGPTVLGHPRWHWVEVKASVSDAGGTCIVRVNGTEEINFTGDTKNGGVQSSISNLRLSGLPYFRFDDVVICDNTGPAPWNDFFGEKVVRGMRPSGAGAVTALTPSAGPNWSCLDESPWTTTDWVSGSTGTDTYACSDVSGLASIDAVQVIAYAAKTDSGPRNLRTVMRSAGGSVVESADLVLSTTVGALGGAPRQTDADGTAWSPAAVNSHEYGVSVV